jgi:dihydroxyacetone kinase-like protein
MAPATAAIIKAAETNATLQEALDASARAAKEGMESTIGLVAHRGLAMQYGVAAVGHLDPGATSCYLICESAARTFRRLCTHSGETSEL